MIRHSRSYRHTWRKYFNHIFKCAQWLRIYTWFVLRKTYIHVSNCWLVQLYLIVIMEHLLRLIKYNKIERCAFYFTSLPQTYRIARLRYQLTKSKVLLLGQCQKSKEKSLASIECSLTKNKNSVNYSDF